MRIERLTVQDKQRVHDAASLFDDPVTDEFITDFLGDDRNHLLIAYVNGRPAGFVTGVELVHPDKGWEMFLYEIGVDEDYRRQGVATALIGELELISRARRCPQMFVLTEKSNAAAIRLYETTGGRLDEGDFVMLTYRFE